MTAVAERGVRSREVSPVLKFVGRRLLGAIVALFVASIVIFAGTVILPGDAASVVLGRNATPENVNKLNHRMHLDQGPVQEYVNWIKGLGNGSLGNSAVGSPRERRPHRSGR